MNAGIELLFIKMESLPDGTLKGNIVTNGTAVEVAELKAGFALAGETVQRLIDVTQGIVENGEGANATSGIDTLITLWDVGCVRVRFCITRSSGGSGAPQS